MAQRRFQLLPRVCQVGWVGARELTRLRNKAFRQTCEVACRGAMSNLEPTLRPKMAAAWGFRDKNTAGVLGSTLGLFSAQDHQAVGIFAIRWGLPNLH